MTSSRYRSERAQGGGVDCGTESVRDGEGRKRKKRKEKEGGWLGHRAGFGDGDGLEATCLWRCRRAGSTGLS